MITDIEEIFEEIDYLIEKEQREIADMKKIGVNHSSYGMGASWGIIEGLRQLKDFINETEQ